jgi:DNA-binding transcriptional LysR family regulator
MARGVMTTMIDLNSLLMFAKVVEANSFSEAARRLNMPVSTLSRRIAELESELGVRLLERSTRRLRLTEVGTEILEHAQQSAELGDAVGDIVSNRRSSLSGVLRLSAPPSISESLLVPLINGFQASYPNVRVQVFVTDRYVDHIVEGVDLVFRFGALRDSTLIARRILTYRHLLVASPAYLEKHTPPKTPRELLGHRLLAFSHWNPRNSWTFAHVNGKDRETLTFEPYLSINDYSGLAHAAMAGAGIGDLPPLVRPDLLRERKLVEIMPKWRFRAFNLSLVHFGNKHLSRQVHLFEDFAVVMAPKLFRALPI